MNFTLTHEQQQLREAARKFAAGSLRDVARQVEEDDEPVSRDWVKKFAAVGFLGINIKEQYGGQGLGHLDAVLVLEEVAKISPAVAFPIFESCFGPMLAIQHFAGEELKQRVIPKVCAGAMRWCAKYADRRCS